MQRIASEKLSIELKETVIEWINQLKGWLWGDHSKPIPYPIRQKELQQIYELLSKNCNVLLSGPVGVGKSHLLRQIKPADRKILYADNCYEIKRTLTQCLLYLCENDKEKCKELMHSPYYLDELGKHIQPDSIPNIAKAIISLTKPHEYILVIDNTDHLTPKSVKLIEDFKDHFTILTTTRNVRGSFASNFQTIHLKNLTKRESITLMEQYSKGLAPEDIILYQNHIYNQTNGNPRAILELVDRYRKEPDLSNEVVRSIVYSSPRKEYDISIFLIIALTAASSLRYIASEIGDKRFRILGSIALLFLILFRYFFRARERDSNIV